MIIKTAKDVQELGALLIVGAHPDDEIFMAGGLMAAAVRNGQRVACVTATRGEKGVQDEGRWPREQLPAIRTRELENSLKAVGVSEHSFLDYADGECTGADEKQAAGKVQAAVEQFRPDTILTWGPDGFTGHPDHQAVSRWVAAAVGADANVLWAAIEAEQYEQLQQADHEANIFFMTGRPPVVQASDLVVDFRLPEDITALKRRAFEAVPSQFEKLLAAGPLDRPGEALARECFVKAKGGQNG